MINTGNTGWLVKQTPSGRVRISEVYVSIHSGDLVAVRGRKGGQKVATAHNDEWTRLVTWVPSADLFATHAAAQEGLRQRMSGES